jgi:hypothetical protein
MKPIKGAKTMYAGDFIETVKDEVEFLPKCKYKDPDPAVCSQCLLKEDCLEYVEE